MLTGQLPFPDDGFDAPSRTRKTSPAPSSICPDLPGRDRRRFGSRARAVAGRPVSEYHRARAGVSDAASPAFRAGSPDAACRTRPPWRRPWVVAAALLTAIGIAAGVVELRRAATGRLPASAMPAPASGPTLAVLPFENVGAADDAYFAAGVSDELASRLTSVAGVRVMSPGSTRQYRNTTKPRDQIARELGVDYLLDGRVRWDRADTCRAARASHGRAGADARRELRVGGPLRREDRRPVQRRRPDRRTCGRRRSRSRSATRAKIDLRPADAELRGVLLLLRGEALRTAEEDAVNNSPRAVEMFERAVALDPKFALAFARLSKAHGDIYWANTDRTAKRLALMRDAAETAVRLDPDLAGSTSRPGVLLLLGSPRL